MFKQDDIAYRIVPIGGYSELEKRRDEALASEEVGRCTGWTSGLAELGMRLVFYVLVTEILDDEDCRRLPVTPNDACSAEDIHHLTDTSHSELC